MPNEFVAKNGLVSQNNTIISGSLTVTQGITGSALTLTGSTGTLFTSNIDTLILTGSLLVTGSTILTGSLNVSQGITGSLFGTSSWASNAITASHATSVSRLNQNVTITSSLSVGIASVGPSENTITLGARDTVNEGGQIGFNAPNLPGGTYSSASFIDLYQNRIRILKGNNTGSQAEVASFNLATNQLSLPSYTSPSSFTGSAAGFLGFDSSGNIITTTGSSAGGGSGTINNGAAGYIAYYPSAGTTIDDTSGIYWDAGNSRMAVGNASPSYKLDVSGDIRATSAIYANANGAMYLRGGDDAELWDINVVNTVGIYGQQDQGVASIKLGSGGGTISGRSGSVGIGTTTPTSASLTVNGNVWARSFTGSLNGTASWASEAVKAYDTPNAIVTASLSGSNQIKFTKGDSTFFALTVGGSGSTFPYNGDAEITGSLTITGSSNLLTIKAVSPYIVLSQNLQSSPSAGGGIIFRDNNSSNRTIGTTIASITTQDSTNTSTGGGIIWTRATSSISFQSANTNFIYNSYGESAIYISGSSNVGIRTTNPNFNFQVSGSIAFTNLTNSAQSYIVGYNTSNGQLFYQDSPTLTITNATTDQINTPDSNNVFVRPQELETSKHATINIFNYLNFS